MNVLIVDDDASVRRSTAIAVECENHEAETADSGRIAILKLAEEQFDMVLLDLRLGDEDGLAVMDLIKKANPTVPVVIFTAHATIQSAVEATRRGADDYLEKPFTPERLRHVLAAVEKATRLKQRIEDLKGQVSNQVPPQDFESEDPPMREAFEVLFRAAKSAASILVLGESGTGKSMAARAVWSRSHLADKPFVTISCPSLSKDLLESELFGHVKGAFTGAVKDQWGKVKAADGGTLFLDEIGELPMEIQPKLLRLLQEKEYERVGESRTRQANVRVIAATNRDLADSVEKGIFREDLFYRLNVISVELPPLRQRRSDLDRFADSYLAFFARSVGRPIRGMSPRAREAMRSYPWPGNLRELRNTLERAVILSRDDEITLEDLPAEIRGEATEEEGGPEGAGGSAIALGSPVPLEDLEREHIRRVLDTASSLSEAAAVLGIDQATLYRKRKKMGLG
ncbi:sigma-54-dependent response regulator transcription factor AlgB [soil metagenome]